MSLPLRSLRLARSRRHIVLAMAMAILFAGIAQAAHFHKDELARGGTDIHCLLCLFAGGSAGPPSAMPTAQAAVPRYCSYRGLHAAPCPHGHDAASYDARGPPSI